MSRLSPGAEALAFRIWANAHPKGWDTTAEEIAEAIGSSPQQVSRVCSLKGWRTRLRKTELDVAGLGFANAQPGYRVRLSDLSDFAIPVGEGIE